MLIRQQVKIDLFVRGTMIRLNKRAVSMLHAKAGQVLGWAEVGREFYLYVVDDPRHTLSGRLAPAGAGLHCHCKALAQALKGDCPTASFRIGETAEINGKRMINVITRINYELRKHPTQGSDPQTR